MIANETFHYSYVALKLYILLLVCSSTISGQISPSSHNITCMKYKMLRQIIDNRENFDKLLIQAFKFV